MENRIHISDDVSLKSIADFLKAEKEMGNQVMRVEVYHKGEVKVKFAVPPYTTEDKQHNYSLSKTFTSSAVGMLVDDGVLSVEDKVTDIFSDKMPDTISENLSEMRVKHLLSMNTGHESCVLEKIKNADDMVSAFFAQEVQHKPGTHFAYNSAASYILSVIVHRYTGMSLFDFLSIRLFEPLGIEGVYWNTYADGNSNGGIGLHASIDDLTKLGVLYLNGGVYNGKRILSEEWVKEATSAISDNSGNGNPDWCAGYGYQIWRNARGGFRGDGAFGQLCMVFDDKDMVVCVQGNVADMQSEIDHTVALAENIICSSDVTLETVTDLIENNYKADKNEPLSDEYTGKIFKCRKNKQGITLVKLEKAADNSVTVRFSNGKTWQSIKSGYGTFETSTVWVKELKPMIIELADANVTEKLETASYYTIDGNTLRLHVRYLCTPHTDTFDFVFDGDRVEFIPEETNLRAKA